MSQSSGARHLDIEGTWNLRDLDGYPTIDGRTTRWRTLYRGNALSELPTESLKALSDLEIKTVIDLRRTEEREFAPSDFASSQRIVYIPIDFVEDATITGQIDYSSPEYTDHYEAVPEQNRPRPSELQRHLEHEAACGGKNHQSISITRCITSGFPLRNW